MLMRNKKEFAKGVLFLASFLVVLVTMFSDIFPGIDGRKVNGLDWADDMFNSLSKGSSYFLPEISQEVEPLKGKTVMLAVKMKSADGAARAATVLGKAGMKAEAADTALRYTGNLGDLAGAVIKACESVYHNDAKSVGDFYGVDGLKVMETYWDVLNVSFKELQNQRNFEEARLVDLMSKKGIEPAYNFYGVAPESIMSKLGMSVGLLAFYVVYTLWYGFAIVHMLSGVGLSTGKPKLKSEV